MNKNIKALMDAIDPDLRVERTHLEQKISVLLSTLTPQEEKIIRMDLGIGVDRYYSVQEIAENLSMAVDEVRHLEAKALRKLKHPSRLKKLREIK